MTDDPLLDILEEAARNERDTRGGLEPETCPPLKLTNGFKPISFYLQDNGEDAEQRYGIVRYSGVVLGERILTTDNPDRWATWVIHYEAITGRWNANSGNYHKDIEVARKDFGKRLFRNCWGGVVQGLIER